MLEIIQYSDEQGQMLRDKIESRRRSENGDYQRVVDEILYNVKTRGKEALYQYTQQFDGFVVNDHNIKVTEEEIREAYKAAGEELTGVIRRAAARIRDYHERQKSNSWMETYPGGEILGQIIRPVETAGAYVPGGKAAYPSSVLMNVIPAKIAGVGRIIVTTPVKANGAVNPGAVVAAAEAGVTDIYKIGGAQAIAAMAFGAGAVPKVDKIVGPGNIYVALAKRSVYGHVGIDSVAGPSEILVMADCTANPVYVAADLLSQAEHDELASAVFITDSRELAERVLEEIKAQTEKSPRREIIEKSLRDYGSLIVVNNLEEGVALSNLIAPEHLELSVAEPFSFLGKIKNAGAIFLGSYSPEPLGDYMAGPNHVLPTGGGARFFSPLSVDDFMKKSSLISFTRESMKTIAGDVIKFAEAEGLYAHANSIKVRLK